MTTCETILNLVERIGPIVVIVVGWAVNECFKRKHELRLARGRVYAKAARTLDELYRDMRAGDYSIDRYHEASIDLGELQIWASKKVLNQAEKVISLIDSFGNNEDEQMYETLKSQYEKSCDALFNAMRKDLWRAKETEVFKFKEDAKN